MIRLEDWIDPAYLQPSAQSAWATAFAAQPHASIALDGFLCPEKFRSLQRLFGIEGLFEEKHYLWQWDEGGRSEIAVSAEAWHRAPPERRAFVERIFAGAHPRHRMGQGIATHFKFVDMLSSPRFMGFLQSVTGLIPKTVTGLMTRIMVGGQYIPPHSDFMPIRDLCAVFYVSVGWQPTFGGRFRHCGPGTEIIPIDPVPNRLLLFQPRADCRHDVEAITAAGINWQRWSYSIWFGTPVPVDGG
jgi:2OG-Fe(II) oxygenase superfamily